MKKSQDKNQRDESEAYTNAKRATKKAARALYPGQIIEAYFIDSEIPERCLVLERPAADADIYDVVVIQESSWHNKVRDYMNTPRKINTDKWTLLGDALFPTPVGK